MAAPPQRWRTLLIIVLAGAAGLGVGSVLAWRGLAGPALVAGIALAGALVAWVVILPGRLAPPVPTQELTQITNPKERLEAADARLRLRHDLRNGALQTLAVVAVLAGAVLGFQQLAEDRSNARADRELTRQGQASERFTRAITQLGDTKRVETRIGGIYGLAQVAEQAPDNNGPVGEVLLAWINHLPRRNHLPWPKLVLNEPPLGERAPDVQAALTVLTKYDKDRDGAKDYAWLAHRLDLHGLSLRDANLQAADLRGADLSGAHLREAFLAEANLSGTRLDSANLLGANLDSANLSFAYLGNAFLGTAYLGDADLDHANLRGADLRTALLNRANLRTADLRGADLRAAVLDGADLRGARANDRTRWPAGFDWRRAGAKPAQAPP